MMLFPRNKHLINVEIEATRYKLKNTEKAISKMEEKRIKLVKIIRDFTQSDESCSCLNSELEELDRRILARHTYLKKYKRILSNLYIELEHRIK